MVPRRHFLKGLAASSGLLGARAWGQFGGVPGFATGPRDIDFEVLASGLAFPEGPVALPDGSVLFVELFKGRLSRYREGAGVAVVAELGGGPNGAALGPDGGVYVANNGGIRPYPDRRVPEGWTGGWIDRVDPHTRAVRRVVTHAGDRPLSGPNDLVFDGAGGFWFTDAGRLHDRWVDHSALCYFDLAAGRARDVVYPLASVNGIALSPDKSRLYVVNALQRQLLAFALAGPGRIEGDAAGKAAQPAILASADGRIIFDSMKVEAGGNAVIAFKGEDPGGLAVVTPDGRMDRLVLGAPVSNLAFAGDDMRTVFLTAGSETNGALLRLRWPRPGLRLAY